MSVFTILIIVAMVISTINEVATKRRKGQQTPGAPPRPGSGPGAERQFPRSGGAEPGSERAESTAAQSAQVLLPDDLWAILTGETRPANRVPEPEFEPEFEPEPEFRLEPEIVTEVEEEPFSWRNDEYGEGAGGSDLADARSRDSRERVRELAAREGEYRNRSPREDILRGEREIVSLEDTLLSDDERHDAFHQRLDASAPGARGGQATASRAVRQRRLRRAIILREVLGPPRGLEDPF